MTDPAFAVRFSDGAIRDLDERLTRSRFVAPPDRAPWSTGTDPKYLAELVDAWRHMDWDELQHGLNPGDHHRVQVGTSMTHVVTIAARTPAVRTSDVPIVLCHGWPSAYLEMFALAHRLSDPDSFGAPGERGHTVIIPSLPGFTYSEPLGVPATRAAMAMHLDALVTEVLGWPRYVALGGDIGASTAAWMAALRPDHVAALYAIHPPLGAPNAECMSVEERHYFDAVERFDRDDDGYSRMMVTRPDTVAAALIDSPVGLLAWIVDKLRAWSDCGGDLRTRWDDRSVLGLVSLYWFTGSIASSFRPYLDWPANGNRPVINVPAGFTLTKEPPGVPAPRSLVERACTDIRQWVAPCSGGHFLPHEEPDRLATDLRTFLAALRRSGDSV